MNQINVFIFCILWKLKAVVSLKCYDSSTANPENIVHCSSNENCYSEYFALKYSDKKNLIQKFDRFCVHEMHCQFRGLSENCLTIDELDPIVQRTFRKKLSSQKFSSSNLMYTRFCCCSKDLCNTMSSTEIKEIFNVTSSTPENGFRRKRTFIASMITTAIIYNFL